MLRSAFAATVTVSIVARGAQRPLEKALRPFFSTTAHDGPASFTRRVIIASPGGRQAQSEGGESFRPSGARKRGDRT